MVVGMILVFLLMFLMPSFLPDVENSMFLGFGIALGIMGAIWKIHTDKKPKVEEDLDYGG